MLLYACQTAVNGRFNYDKNSGVWAEDNCPWDYDHILPHSWIDRMNGEFSDICQWLKNSLGNLAPLPFEMNRSLSDNARDHLYPYCGMPGREAEAARVQKDYCIDGHALETMRGFAKDRGAQQEFIVSTLIRFSQLYAKWYSGLSFDKLLRFGDGQRQLNEGVSRRRRVLSAISQRTKNTGSSFICYFPDGKRRDVGSFHEPEADWFVWDWVSVFMKKSHCAIELSLDRQCQQYKVGIARLTIGDADGLDDTITERLVSLAHTTWQFPKDDQYWHVIHRGEVSPEMTDEEIVEALFATLHDLQQVV